METFVRFAQVCGELPTATPKPHLSVGDDATLGAEWDIGIFHIEFQVGNDPEVDAIIFEVDEGDISEIPLAGNSRVLAAIIAKIISGRQA